MDTDLVTKLEALQERLSDLYVLSDQLKSDVISIKVEITDIQEELGNIIYQ